MGRALALSRTVPRRSKIGAIGRMLPEYFTDDPVVVKRVVIRGLAIKSHERRSKASSSIPRVRRYTSLQLPSRAIALGERRTIPRGVGKGRRRGHPIQTTVSLHSRRSRNSPDE